MKAASYFLVSKTLVKDRSKKNVLHLKKRVFVTMQVGCMAYLAGVLL